MRSNGTVTQWKVYQNDTQTITLQLNGIDNIEPGAVLAAAVLRGGASVALAGVTVQSEPNRIIAIPLTTWLATPPAKGVYELRVTMDGLTWPDQGRAELEVA